MNPLLTTVSAGLVAAFLAWLWWLDRNAAPRRQADADMRLMDAMREHADSVDEHHATAVRQPVPDSAYLLVVLAALAEAEQRRALTAMRPAPMPTRRRTR